MDKIEGLQEEEVIILEEATIIMTVSKVSLGEQKMILKIMRGIKIRMKYGDLIQLIKCHNKRLMILGENKSN